MDIHYIAEQLNIYLHYYNGIPATDQLDDEMPIILLDARKSEAERRKDFFHELGHVLKHVGIQDVMYRPFTKLQEMQADRFMFYASIPVYMLGEILRDVYSYGAFEKNVAEQFNLPIDHVRKRLLHINNRIYLSHQDALFKRRQASAEVTDDSFKQFMKEHKQQFYRKHGWV
jgi:Zn-dependent peptidase ImmA (M78 family)